MSIQILTDSSADILPEEAKALGIHVIPLTVNLDGKEYADGVEIDHNAFFEKLPKCSTLPTTSQIAPAAFENAFRKLTANGDTVIAIILSSRLSGTYQSACIAAEEFEGKVFVIDSLSATVGERLLVLACLEYCRQGLSPEEIADRLNEDKNKVKILAVLDTLEYLKKGGRISATTAFAGSLLSIKPIITVDDGYVKLVGKARGTKNGNTLLRKMIDEAGGITFSRPYCMIYSGLNDDLLQKFLADNADIWQGQTGDLPTASLGAVIGTHIGPGAYGLAFFQK